MNVVWIFLAVVRISVCYAEDESLEEKSTEPNEIELFPPNPTYAGQTRMPRTFMKKLHSGVSFLAGMKLGALLSKKGFELGHGKIASTHSFRIFGKSVNSAMSLAYGDSDSLLPIVNDVPDGGDSLKEDKKYIRLTVIENPSNETVEKLKIQATNDVTTNEINDESEERKEENLIVLYQDTIDEHPKEEINGNLFEEHNERVREFNKANMRRKNSKF